MRWLSSLNLLAWLRVYEDGAPGAPPPAEDARDEEIAALKAQMKIKDEYADEHANGEDEARSERPMSPRHWTCCRVSSLP